MNPDPQDEITRLRLELHHAYIRINGLEKRGNHEVKEIHETETERLRIQLSNANDKIKLLQQPTAFNQSTKESIVLFFVQVVMFSVLCVNFRAIASAQYNLAAVSDFIIASIQFFVIKRIAGSDDSIKHWAGYALGSVAGSYLGIYISTKL